MNTAGNNDTRHRAILQRIAHIAMLEKGLLPDFSEEALAELATIVSPGRAENSVRDMRGLLWSSIDNDDSLDLDQLTVAEPMDGQTVRVFVAVADVDVIVRDGSAIDSHARHNTTSVYTAAEIFSMLPEKLSTNLTSLNLNEDRLAFVVDMVIDEDGSVKESDVYKALVRSHGKLAYNGVAAWLEGRSPAPQALAAVDGLQENLRIQDKTAQCMRTLRRLHGALSFETIEAKPIFADGQISKLEVERRNRAKDIIEDFMIAANGVTARYLSSKGYPSLRRIVRTPNRWERIVEIADEHGFELSPTPDPKGLEEFLVKAQQADPVRFPDLSLSIIKLLGPGEYMAEFPGRSSPEGHFGLAVKDYTHSTAPNRRYPDLITQRLLKVALAGNPLPYDEDTLTDLAKHCTAAEDAAKKVERRVAKSAAALLLESRIGDRFDAIVTGAAQKGTWVRLFDPPIEGRLVHGFDGLDVGRKIHVELLYADVEKGFIDFKRVK
jgi:VacB/RNase II family 3'-5' exoribonuclease